MICIGQPRSFIGFGVLFLACFLTVKSDDSCDIEIENTLKTLLTPQETPTIQLQALRKDILRRFANALDRSYEQDDLNYKRSMSSLAQWNNLPLNKRNLEALARAGLIHTLPNDDQTEDTTSDDDLNEKRSLANLAKNGQLPANFQINEGKRGIESLARNGELKSIQQLLDELHSKRNIESLARNFDLPGSYDSDKRFVGSLARSGDLPYHKRNLASIVRDGGHRWQGKRNVAALLRQDSYLNQRGNHNTNTEMPQFNSDKRNIGSIKAQQQYSKFKRSIQNEKQRQKRETVGWEFYQNFNENDEYPQPVFQNQNVYDYEELMKELTGFYPNTDKRFLGSVARSGWFRPSSTNNALKYRPEKRHIGALARLGWLPTLRNVRRFNRSGRSTNSDECNRETTANGQTENNAIPEDDTFPLDEKRFLLQPAVDNILLRKLFMMHPRTHSFISQQ